MVPRPPHFFEARDAPAPKTGKSHPRRTFPTQDGQFPPKKKKRKKNSFQIKQLVLIVASDIYLNARASCWNFIVNYIFGFENGS